MRWRQQGLHLRGLLTQYKAAGIKRIVALRGDLPSGMGMASGELRHANDLVEFIREETGDHFHIEVAAYPEMHPQARNFLEDDIANFVRKANAGADSAITQYFFNADSYFYFVERAWAMGVNIPIVPGIMPITNTASCALLRCLRCGNPALDPQATGSLRRRHPEHSTLW